MRNKKTIEDEINEFLTYWDIEQISEFFRHVEPLIQLYEISETDDWVADQVGEENSRNVRLIRTVYLMSRMCDLFAGRFANINCHFKNLWKRLEKENNVVVEGN